MAYLEDARLTRESWADARQERLIGVLCPACGVSIKVDPDDRSTDCSACGVAVMTERRQHDRTGQEEEG